MILRLPHVLLALLVIMFPVCMSIEAATRVHIHHVAGEIDLKSMYDLVWSKAVPVSVGTYWSGQTAPLGRSFEARLLWSDTGLYVRFEAEQHEPLIVSPNPDTNKKANGLWNRDVCEIFIAPNRNDRN